MFSYGTKMGVQADKYYFFYRCIKVWQKTKPYICNILDNFYLNVIGFFNIVPLETTAIQCIFSLVMSI